MSMILRPLLVIGMFAVPSVAFAQDAAPRLSVVIAALEDQGYVITDIEVEHDKIEVEARSADGRRWDIDIDPANGAVIQTREDR